MSKTSMTSRNETPTMPPSAHDSAASEFEEQIKESGESSARWSRLMELLEHQGTEKKASRLHG